MPFNNINNCYNCVFQLLMLVVASVSVLSGCIECTVRTTHVIASYCKRCQSRGYAVQKPLNGSRSLLSCRLLSVYLSIYLSVCLSVCLSIHLSIYPSIYLIGISFHQCISEYFL